MWSKKLLSVLLMFVMVAFDACQSARGGGRGKVARGRGRLYNSRMPVIIQHRNPAAKNYYENKDVHEWPMGNDTLKSKMEIDPTTQKDAGYYECQANNKYSVDSRGFRTDYVMITY